MRLERTVIDRYNERGTNHGKFIPATVAVTTQYGSHLSMSIESGLRVSCSSRRHMARHSSSHVASRRGKAPAEAGMRFRANANQWSSPICRNTQFVRRHLSTLYTSSSLLTPHATTAL